MSTPAAIPDPVTVDVSTVPIRRFGEATGHEVIARKPAIRGEEIKIVNWQPFQVRGGGVMPCKVLLQGHAAASAVLPFCHPLGGFGTVYLNVPLTFVGDASVTTSDLASNLTSLDFNGQPFISMTDFSTPFEVSANNSTPGSDLAITDFTASWPLASIDAAGVQNYLAYYTGRQAAKDIIAGLTENALAGDDSPLYYKGYYDDASGEPDWGMMQIGGPYFGYGLGDYPTDNFNRLGSVYALGQTAGAAGVLFNLKAKLTIRP